MKQFDVYDNPDPTGRRHVPYVVIIRHDRFAAMSHALVAPLIDLQVARPQTELFPTFTIEGRDLVLDVTDMAAIATRHLQIRAATLSGQHERIVKALDLLVSGY